MPRFRGLRGRRGTRGSRRTRRSPLFQPHSPAQDDSQDCPSATEEFKRPRAVSASVLAAAHVPVLAPTAGPSTTATVPVGSAADLKSIYSRAAGWIGEAATTQEESRQGHWGSSGSLGAREQAHFPIFSSTWNIVDQKETKHQDDKDRVFSAEIAQFSVYQPVNGTGLLLRNISDASSAVSDPVDIPGVHSSDEGSFAEAEEEGWVSLWNTYTRLFPGTYTGCSPPGSTPPPDSPLYAACKPKGSSVLSTNDALAVIAPIPDTGANSTPAAKVPTIHGGRATTWGSAGGSLASATPADDGRGLPTTPTARVRRRGGHFPSTTTMEPRSPPGGPSSVEGNGAVSATAGTGGCLRGARAGGARNNPPAQPLALTLVVSPTTSEERVKVSKPATNFQSRRHQQRRDDREMLEGDGDHCCDDMLLDDCVGLPPQGYSWGELSQRPMEEAGKTLRGFSGKGVSVHGGERERHAYVDVSDVGEDDGDDGDGVVGGIEDFDFDASGTETDMDLTEGLMFELEM